MTNASGGYLQPPPSSSTLPPSDCDELYNHSTFADLVLVGLVGLVPAALAGAAAAGGRSGTVSSAQWDRLRVEPLVPPEESARRHYAVDNLQYRGRALAVVWDPSGERYGVGAGLRVFVDGRLAASSAELGPLDVPID